MEQSAGTGPSVAKTAFLFSVGRFGLFGLMAVLLWVATDALGHPLNGFPLLFAALLASSIVGLFLFSRQREQLAQALTDRRASQAQQAAERRARLDDDGG